MIIKKSITGRSCGFKIWATAVVALAVLSAGTVGYAQSPADIARQNMEEVVRLTQAKMTDEVLVNFIKTSGKTYSLTSDDLLYLNSRGVSQPVLDAMLVASGGVAPAPAPASEAPPAPAGPPETPTIDYFQAHLTPYGQWIQVPDVGAAWVPSEASEPGWRPYMNSGHWQFSDAGWFWQSDYPWGDMAFHYGRWINNEFTGGRWAWVPGYNWAPSWVSWREGSGGMGWAPLPWGVEFRVGHGLFWHGSAVVAGVDFGLGFGAFCFVGSDHFWGGNYNRFVFDESRSRVFFEHSTFNVGYKMEGGRFVAEGLGREHMSQITHHEIVVVKVTELRKTEETRNFAKRTAEHKELAHAVVHGRETARPEARERAAAHPGVNEERGEHGVTPHKPEARSTTPGGVGKERPGANEEHGTATHPLAPHPTNPGGATPGHPGTPAERSKAPPPRPGQSRTNQPPSAPR
jgi:hypothetical protein